MALAVIITRRSTRLPFLLSALLSPSLAPPSSSSPFFSSSSSIPSPPQCLPPFNPHSQSSLLSPETSDFESDSDEPTSHLYRSSLPSLLQLISHAKSQSASQAEALANLRTSSTIKPTKHLVYWALWELRWDWESAVLAFRWAGDSILDCRRAWHLMLWVLGKQGRFDLAWSLVRRMHRKSVLTQRAMVIMMERYAAANEVSKAIKTFHVMEKFKIDADSTAFHALLCTLCKNRNVEEAEELLLLNRKFFPLATESFNIILNGWCNIMIDVAEAKRVWREMSNCCVTPDGTSYAHIIYCFSRVGNLFDSLRLYDEMKTRGWVPNIVIYNALIYVLTRENCLKEARNVFHKIQEAGLQPDLETHNFMICPLCEAHKVDEAREIMDDMIKKGINPTLETYHAFAKAEDVDGTLKLLKRMKDVNCGPNGDTFLLIFDKFFRLGESENALRIWSEMRRYNISADYAHYIALVQGLAANGWIPKAMEFYNEMKSKGFPADPKLDMIFNAFVSNHKNHWGRGKEYIKAPQGKYNINRSV